VTIQLPEHLELLRDDLETAWPSRTAPRPVRPTIARRRPRLALAGIAIVAVIGLVLLRSDRGPGSIARAVAAVGVQPPDVIVHWTSTDYAADGSFADRQEVWGATSAPFGQRSITQDRPDLPPVEQSSQGDAVTVYDPTANVLFVRTVAGGTLEADRATRIGADPARVATFLARDDTRDEGVVEVAGRRVHRFLMTPTTGGSCTYDVDPVSYYGLAFACQGGPNGHGSETWEYLPRSAGTSSLLSVAAQHPGARVDRAPIGTCTVPMQYEMPTMPPCYVNAPGG
jgi:hypothetical protein